MAEDLLSFQGVEVQKAYQTLASSGIKAEIAREIIGIWIGESAIKARQFGYSTPLTDAEPACSPPPFARTFSHQDWVDGESIVQAGETPTEKGFNDRFHRIESDFDRLGALVAQSYACMSGVRATVAASLREISNELNRLNADLAELRRNMPTGTKSPGTITGGLKYVGKTKYFDKAILAFEDADGRIINLPDMSAVTVGVTTNSRAPQVAELFGRDEDIGKTFNGAFTKKVLVEKYGDRLSSDGYPLADLLVSLPDDQSFNSLDEMVNTLAEKDAALIKGLGADANMRASVGIAAGTEAKTAPVGNVEGISPGLGNALVASGIKTVADLDAISTDRMIEIGRASGIDVSRGSAFGILARGKVIGHL